MDCPQATLNEYTPVQLMTVIEIAVKLQEEIWRQFGFKFQITFITFMLTQDFPPSKGIKFARQVWNSKTVEGMTYWKFYTGLQEWYIESLEDSDDE